MANLDKFGEVDVNAPSLARVYDYVLGGGQNFAADRELAEKILAIVPNYQKFATCNRAFLRRTVMDLLAGGVNQFLDLGSGLPTVGAVHEIVHDVDPNGRIVYVDHDPVAVESCKLIVGNDERVGVICGDLRDVGGILEHNVTANTLDLTKPVGLLMVAVLHCIPDDDNPAAVIADYHYRLPAGSRFAASHASGDSLSTVETNAAVQQFADAGISVVSRTRAQFAAMLGPWEPEPDGIVHTSEWRPDEPGDESGEADLGYAVVACSALHKNTR